MTETQADIVIIGTGFGGLGAAIQLRAAGFRDLVLLERGDDVGGVWRDNTYPGCACDIESHLYSFSFALNPRWSRLFAPQREILDYLRDCAHRFGVRPHIRFRHAVTSAAWNGATRRWEIETTGGRFSARILISAAGALSEPTIPQLPGAERFAGAAFHSARWNHDLDLTNRHVAVIGTGASAAQFIPQIQPQVARLTVYQRTPAWVVPRQDVAISERMQRRFSRFPFLMRLLRGRLYLRHEIVGLGFRHPWMMRLIRHAALSHLRQTVHNPALRQQLTPTYEVGCKRLLLSDDYYPALTQSNVEVVTDSIAEIRGYSIRTARGAERPADTIIYATGFLVTDNPSAQLIRGREGKTLTDALGPSPRAHLGTTVVGFPNFFLLQGPNTGLGHSSVILMMEYQFQHVIRALRAMRRRGAATIEPTPQAQAEFVADVDRRMRGTVWVAGGCRSWYLDATGRNATLWPGSVPSFGRRVAPFRPGDYDLGRT